MSWCSSNRSWKIGEHSLESRNRKNASPDIFPEQVKHNRHVKLLPQNYSIASKTKLNLAQRMSRRLHTLQLAVEHVHDRKKETESR